MNIYFYNGGIDTGRDSLSATKHGLVKAGNSAEGLYLAEQELLRYAEELHYQVEKRGFSVSVLAFSLVEQEPPRLRYEDAKRALAG